MHQHKTRQWSALITVLALIGSLVLVLFPTTPATAAGGRDFTNLYKGQMRGDITITGNSLLACDNSNPDSKCSKYLAGAANLANNDVTMENLDLDNDPDTINSSMATVAITPGGTIKKAFLFWGAATTGSPKAEGNADDWKKITFTDPAGIKHGVEAEKFDQFTNVKKDYSAVADVTDIVATAGPGVYWGANVQAGLGSDRYAGWSLVVVYEDESLPMRDLQVFTGYKIVGSSKRVEVPVEGFLAPPTGPVNATVGMVVYEGDPGFGGDKFEFNGQLLSDAQSPADNFFTGRVSEKGELRTDRNPAHVANAIDAKTVSANGILENKQTETTAAFITDGDWYYPAALTTAIDLYVPDVKGAKTITNLSGNVPAKVGDILEYKIEMSNTDLDNSDKTVFTDTMPPGTEYVPETLTVIPVGETEPVPVTDEAGDDVGEVTDQKVTVRLGEGANAIEGGEIPFRKKTTVAFNVVVVDSGAETTVSNTAEISYQGKTIPTYKKTTSSNTTGTPVESLADPTIEKTGPDSIVAGEEITWTLTAKNNGPRTAKNVIVKDVLPAEVSFVSATVTDGDSCYQKTGEVLCPIGELAKDATKTITVVGKVDPATTVDSITNSSSISTDTSDKDSENNDATKVTTLSREADMGIAKTVDPETAAPGEKVTYTLTATNYGPSSAKNVSITDTLPNGLTVESVTGPTADACTFTSQTVTCSIDEVDVDQNAPVTVVAKLSDSWTATDALVNDASVSSDTLDRNSANNTSSATFTPTDPKADLKVVKTTTSAVKAGAPVTYQIKVTNDGPSVATGVTVTDKLTEGLSNPSVTSADGTCTVDGVNVSCDLGSFAVGETKQVTVAADVAASVTDDISNTARITSTTNDPNPDNDWSTVQDPVETSADLVIVKTAGEAVAGSDLSYTLTVTNNGISDAQNAVVTDTLPANVTFVSATGEGATCAEADGTVTCDLGTVANKASKTITVVVNVPSDIANASDIENTAEVSSDTDDPNGDNNTATSSTQTSTNADLSVTKTGPDSATAGEDIKWDLVVTNNGPSDAANASLADTLPAAIADGATVTSDTGTCSVVDHALSCDFGTLASGATATITVTGTVDSDFNETTVDNTATVSSDTPDLTDSNNSDSSTTPVKQVADLGITKTGDATVVAGEDVTWTLTIDNTGPSTARNIAISDVLPEGVTYKSSSGNVTCEATGRVVNCSLATLISGGTTTVDLVGTVDPGTAPGTTLENTAKVSSDTPEPEGADENNTSSSTTDVSASADLAVSKTVNPNPLVSGASAQYTVTATNNGPSTARNAVVTDTLPDGLVPTNAQGPGNCTISGQTVTCLFDSLVPGASVDSYIDVTVNVEPGNSVTNTVNISSDTTDPDPNNNKDSLTSQVNASADLAVTKTADRDAIAAGEVAAYTLVVTNAGPSTAANAVITDVIPAGTTFVTASDQCEYVDTPEPTVTCSMGDLARGEIATARVTVKVPADSDLTSFDNTATGSSDTPDPNEDNNSSTSTVTVSPEADVSVVKSASADSVVAGDQVTWTLDVTNAGPSLASAVEVTDSIPAGLTIDSASFDGTDCTVTGQDITCPVGDMLVGTRTITVLTTVDASYTGEPIENTATVSSTTSDSNGDNNSDSATVKVTPAADIAVEKSLASDGVVPGETVSYTVTATNNGPSDAAGVVVTDALPAGLSDVSASGTGPAGDLTCSVADPADPAASSGDVSCTVGALAVGQAATITVSGTLDSAFTGSLTNAASASSDTPDPSEGNNTSSVTTQATPKADLVLEKSASVAEVAPGNTVDYTLKVTNNGPSVATTVTISDGIPTGTELVSYDDDCVVMEQPSGRSLVCQVGDLAVGESATAALTLKVPAYSTATQIDNDAATSSGVDDPDTSNNGSTATVGLSPKADVSVVKSMDVANPVPGESVTFTLDIANAGPSVATNVSVSDTLPAGLSDVTVVGSDGVACSVADAVDSSGDVTCTVASLDVDATATVTVTGTVTADLTGNVENTATVSSDTPDPDESNNSSSVTGTSSPKADVSVVKSMDVANPVPGESVTFTVIVTNDGPSLARGVHVKDSVPAGLEIVSAVLDDDTVCAVTGQDVDCLIGDMPVGSRTVTINVNVPADYTEETVVNTATASSDTPDPDESNNSSSVTGTSSPKADVSVVKSMDVANPVPGESVTFTLDIANAGPSVATNVSVSDTLPAGLSDVTVVGSDGVACSVADAVDSSGDVTCTVASLDVDATATVTVTGTVTADLTGNVENTATVSSDTPDPDESNNSSSVSGTSTPRADLVLEKTADATQIAAGESVSYALKVTNNGPSVATNVVVADGLPAGMVLDSYDDNCEISASGENVICRLGIIAVGNSATANLTFTVPVDSTTSEFTNTAATSSAVTDPDPSNNGSSATVGVTTSADVSITKSAPDTVIAGDTITWNLVVNNAGPSVARTVEVTDVLPANVIFDGVTGAECTEADGQLSCALGDLDPNAPVTIAVTGTVDSDAAAGPLDNTASVTTTTADPDEGNNTSGSRTEITQSADVALAKTVSADSIAPGESVTYTLTATNNGLSTARDVVMSDVLPEGLTVTSATAATDDACTVTANTVACEAGDLAVGDTATATVVAQLSDSWNATDPIVNAGRVSTSTVDPAPENNTSSATFTPTGPVSDVSMVKTTVTAPVAGGTVTYTLVASNAGPSLARDVTVSDTLPEGLSNVVVNAPTGECTVVDSQIDCALADLAVGESAEVTVSADVASSLTGDLTNAATAGTSSTDPDESNNSSSVTDTVETSADLAIVKTAGEAVAGSDLTYTLTVSNNGLSDARNTVVTDVLPADVDFVSVEGEGCSELDGTVSCDLGTVAAGASVTATITVNVPSDVANAAEIENTATVTSDTPDPDESNNTATARTTTGTDADLAIVKTGPDQVIAGETVEWTVAVTNSGPSDAVNVAVTDTLPDAIEAGASVQLTDGTLGSCLVDDHALSCDFGTLASGATASAVVTGTVKSDLTDTTMTNTAQVSSDTPDPTDSNNSSSSTTSVKQVADLTIAKSGPAEVIAGESATWTMTIGNAGPSTARAVVLSDTLPEGVSFDSYTSESLTCEVVESTITCELAELAAGATATVEVVGAVDASADTASTMTNTATVSSDTPEPEDGADDNSSSSSTEVKADADVSVIKTVDPSPLTAGEAGMYTITVANAGPSVASNVVVTDILPVDATADSIQGPAPCEINGKTVTCTFASIAPGASHDLYLTVKLEETTSGQVTNMVTVSSDTPDSNLDNNEFLLETPVDSVSDVSVVKTMDSDTAIPGESVTYTIVATNAGPSAATGVVIEDLLPAGLSWISVSGTIEDAPVSCEETTTDGSSIVTCTLDVLPAGQQATITVTAVVDADMTGELSNTATVTTTADDPDESDNSTTVTGKLTPQADLAITKELIGTPQAGGEIRWRVGVNSFGPSTAVDVVVTDVLPATMHNARIDGDIPECSVDANVVTCAFETMQPGASISFDIVGELASDAGTTVSNSASVMSTTTDPVSENNTATADGSVTPEPTEDPSDDPSDDPSGEPTDDPSGEPTPAPSGDPSDDSSSTPTGDVTPSQSPTHVETLPVTGVDAGPQAIVAIALLLVGMMFVTIRRRQQN
ncbi:MAG: DUF11 domain-containing protein [Actinomycetaceae bacterium]|nr:DUF11 domain-containing protein [Actinomycetaceae bacterium]